MRVKYITNAAVEIEHNGFRVLCDPWFTDGAYYGSWFHWPVLPSDIIERYKDVDAIYISHVHPDHFDPATLAQFSKDIPIFICEYGEKYFLRHLQALGFKTITEVPNRATVKFKGGLEMEIIAADDNNPIAFAVAYNTRILKREGGSKNIDSMAIFKADGQIVFNTNDCPWVLVTFALPYILNKYERIDVLLTAYAGAGPFPQCYDYEPDDMRQMAIQAAYSYLSQPFELVTRLNPRFYIPFAGQYILGGRYGWMNQFKGTFELDDLERDLKDYIATKAPDSKMVLLDFEGTLDCKTGAVEKPFTDTNLPARNAYIKDVLGSKAFDFDSFPLLDKDTFNRKMMEARARLYRKQEEFSYFSQWVVNISDGEGGWYAIPLDTRSAQHVNAPVGARQYNVSMDQRLFHSILARKANWNNAEVGSHLKIAIKVPAGIPSMEAMLPYIMAYFQGDFEKTENTNGNQNKEKNLEASSA